MSDWYLAPALVQLRDEINKKWPNRDKSSDGSIGDSAHASRKSEHNPEKSGEYKGRVNAIDVDKDGVNPEVLLKAAIADPRTWYVIWNGHIYSRTYNFRKRVYNGSNKHTQHLHISIYPGRAAGQSKASWGLAKVSTASKPPAKPKAPKLSSDVKPNKRAPQVKVLQKLLIDAGFGPIRGAVTTFYGNNTQAAVARFHKKYKQFATSPYDVEIGPKGFAFLWHLVND